jgi:polyisoprenoid-binding protein YceI
MKKMTVLICAVAMMLMSAPLQAQKLITREGFIRFFGSTPLENIEGVSRQAGSALDLATGEVVFQVLVNSFKFEKALMQEHFNENYAESEKFPKAIFKGQLEGDFDLRKAGKYNASLKGTMTFHGVTQPINVPVSLEVLKDGSVKLNANFNMVPEAYEIKIPGTVRDKIAKEMEVTVSAHYKPA